jgi:hypothetical protein
MYCGKKRSLVLALAVARLHLPVLYLECVEQCTVKDKKRQVAVVGAWRYFEEPMRTKLHVEKITVKYLQSACRERNIPKGPPQYGRFCHAPFVKQRCASHEFDKEQIIVSLEFVRLPHCTYT